MTARRVAVVGIGAFAREVLDALAAVGIEVSAVAPGASTAGEAVAHVVDPAGYPASEAFRATASDTGRTAVVIADTRTDAPGEWPLHGGPAALRAAVERSGGGARVNAVAVVGPRDRAVGGAVAAAVVYLTGPHADLIGGQCLTVDATLAPPAAADAGHVESVVAMDRADADPDAIVVVGMGLVLPGADSPDRFWDLLQGERTVFGEPGGRIDLAHIWSADPTEVDRTYSRVSGFMPPDADADPGEDFTEGWLRRSIAQAMATVTTSAADRHLFAVGLTADGSHHLEQSLVVREVRRLLGDRFDAGAECLLREAYPLAVDSPERMLPYRIARRAASDLPADTEVVVLDTACSSSLYSIDIGARALRAGEADVAVCGGAFALGVQNLVLFSKLRGLSRSGAVRPLDSRADGVLFTDGAAVLVLKTLARARADNDTVLGCVAGFGGSSDGKGKAIYAPNPVGQRIALRRAWDAAGMAPTDIDWVIAHATGTPTGDRTELSVLNEMSGPTGGWTVSSNKSVVGHPGWAAGAVSAVHALLALRHGRIPAQRHFTELPTGLGPEVRIAVPSHDVAWHAGDRPRTVAISAMGFGGTNGHLLLTDTPPSTPPTAVDDPEDPVVVTGWAAHLPGDPDVDRVRDWLRGGAVDWPARFPEDYPLPSPVDMRLAPSAIAAMDRSQVIAVRCADALAGDWFDTTGLAQRTGVFVGHSGPTTAAVRHDTRAYLADLAARGGIDGFADLVAGPVLAAVPAATEDTYPGLMPNIIPARIAQRLDLHGPNMALDAGLDSFTSALVVATRSLRDGEIDVAFVVGVAAAAEQVRHRNGREPAEGAVGVVLTRRGVAAAHHLTELAVIEVAGRGAAATDSGRDRVHHGAESAVELLRLLHTSGGRTVLAAQEDHRTPSIAVTVAERADAKPRLRDLLTRHALELWPTPPRTDCLELPAIPGDCVVVTDRPDVFSRKAALVLGLDTAPEAADTLVRETGARHVRVVLTAGASFEDALTANDLVFVVIRTLVEPLDAGGSLGVLLLDGFDGAVPRPETGLSTGLLRSVEHELPGCLVFAVITDSPDLPAGLAALAAESGRHRHLPVAYLRGGTRYEMVPRPIAATTEDADPGVVADPVVLATGGARGITARLVRELLADTSPRAVWLLGTAPEPDSDTPVELPDKATALRELMVRHPGEKMASLNRRFTEAVRAAERAATIRDLRARYGEDRVHYRQCDVRDASGVAAVVDEVLDVDGGVDVVVHGAGLVRSTALTRKSLDDYRLVRDVKVRGDRNLRSALATRPPALWCALSSIGAFIGMRGEADYQAGNEYLMLSAATSRAAGRDELAIVSGLWVESGMASAYATGSPFASGLADFTQLTDQQGEEFLRAELAGRGDPAQALATTWLGETEWSTLHRNAPGLRDRAATRPPAFLTEPPESDSSETRWRCTLDLADHPWLLDHLVDGRPTVPATVVLQIAAEAATALVPWLVAARFTDIVLSTFIRAPRASWPRHLVVTASRDGDEVRVRLDSAPSGPVPSREHARMTVHLAAEHTPARRIVSGPPPGIPVPDVYQLGGSLRLQGVFGGLRDARLHGDGGSARFGMPHRGTRLDGFTVPSATIDALLRTSVLDGRNAETVTMIVPTAIAAVEIHVPGNDREWDVRCTGQITLRYLANTGGDPGECVATAPDGTVLATVRGISSVPRDVYEVSSANDREAAGASA
ncbi:SDR family oxidoreductase [Umezawaea sp. Da 62-37]|uniref:SDR family oxidoreductase n=1 Tax=Umezawaea sp. Da 62-37 TaxID=3075927 RepID=UPI0028F7139A|nr:SDR family NAD(P)-dependent oxidoreductase [Umezawaea sp. Da 62-37]WNV87753.1 SDR family NAD(P)-dependent oxidoreductase [Umezawaea sp. Da 62-37]